MNFYPSYPTISLVCAVLPIVVLPAGVAVLFAHGRSRTLLPGVGFALICAGLVIRLLSVYLIPGLGMTSHLSSDFLLIVSSTIPSLVMLAGWVLIIVALFRLLRSTGAGSAAPPAWSPPEPPGQFPSGPAHGAPPPGPPPGPPRY